MGRAPGKHVVALGGSVAGLTAAYELKQELGRRHRVTGIDRARWVLGAGNEGIVMCTDRVYARKKRKWQVLIPGPWAHWIKLAFEKYYLWKMRTGRVTWR